MRVLVAVAVAVAAPAARADDLVPTRVTAALRDTQVAFEIGVHVPIDATYFPAAAVQVALPGGGVVTGGRATSGGIEHALALTEVARASAAFDDIGSAAVATPRAFAVHVTAWSGRAQIEVAAPATSTLDVVLAIVAPSCFSHDRRWVQLPASWRGVVKGAVEQTPDGCTPSSDGPWLGLSAPLGRGVSIAVSGGRLVLPHADIARIEIDLGSELASVPDDLATVIVVDASRSMSDAQRDVQRTIVASYLAHTPHSMVQVIAYSRTPQPLLPSWMASSAAGPRLDHELRRITGANGSNVDAGLVAAGEWLARMPGTHRVIVMTDELVPERLASVAPATWAAQLPAHTLVHVVALRDTDGALQREDGVLYGELAKATGGIGVTGGTHSDAAMLVRPLSLDRIAFDLDHWEGTAAGCPDRLDAGTSCTWFARATASPAVPVRITGLLWNTKVSRVVAPDRSHARAIARELAALGGFDTPVQLEIDRAAMAVDTVWSLFGTWGGRGGYADQLGFGTSGTMSGHSAATIVDRFGTATAAPALDLRPQFAEALAACGPYTHGSVRVRLTLEEITDVSVRDAGDDTHCIEEAIWSTLVHVQDAPAESVASFTI